MSSRQDRAVGTDSGVLPDDGTVLLLAPAIGHAGREACLDLLCQHGFSSSNVVHVLYMESAAERFGRVDDRVHEHPAESAIVAVGAGGVVGTRGPEPEHRDYHVDAVADPADLTGLGMHLTDRLSAWYGDANDVVVCFDSLSILLQYSELDRVFRFLHTITGRLGQVGAAAHFHLDPAAHDERTVSRLSRLFDAVVEVTTDGERTRRD